MLAAAAVLVALSLLAPSGVQAHPGHVHAAAAGAATPAAAAPAREVIAFVAAAAAKPAHVHKLAHAPGRDDGHEGEPCSGCCCSGTCTAGCCAVWIAPLAGVRPPADERAAFPATAERETGITPGTLPEPPNAIV